jgi:Skp family chaperone for outer membrane proteins
MLAASMRAAAILILALFPSGAEAAPPKVAVVRVADVFRQLEDTVKANQELQAKREAINKDKRLAEYQAMYADLEYRRKQLAEAGGKIDAATRAKLEREYAIKRREAKSLLDDFESYRAERTREINAEMVEGMKLRLQRIHDAAGKIAGEEGFDWVLDGSGNTNTGVPLLLYAKSPNDLTDRVLGFLGKAGPEPEQKPATTAKPPRGKR